MASEIKTEMKFCFTVTNNVVNIEDILEMNNIDYMLTVAARYKARIQCHYISCAMKIHLDNLNEVKNCFT